MNLVKDEKISKEGLLINRSINLRGYTYTMDEAYAARDNGQLLCLRLDTNYECNIACKYCYSSPLQTGKTPQMSKEMLKSVIDQAYDIGMKAVIYLGGGEPLLYEHFWWFMEYLNKLNVVPVVFTNGILVTKETARRLYEVGATVMIKFDGLEETQNKLTGPKSFDKIHRGFEMLLESGYGDLTDVNETRMGAAPCACNVNYQEIPDIWRMLRKNGVYPNVERATSIGRAKIGDLSLDNSQTKWLYDTLREIDREEFGIQWESPYSGYPAHSCYISLIGCHVKADGGVALCSEFDSHANINEKPLADILNEDLFVKVRHSEKLLKEPCSKCEHLRTCLGGCRSKCLNGSGSLFGHDPSCTLCQK